MTESPELTLDDPWEAWFRPDLRRLPFGAQRRQVRRVLQKLSGQGPPPGSDEVVLGVLPGATVDLILPVLTFDLLRMGLVPRFVQGTFGAVVQDCWSPTSSISKAAPVLAVSIISPMDVPYWPPLGCSEEEAQSCVQKVVDHYVGAAKVLYERCGTETIFPTFHRLPEWVYGNLGVRVPDDRNRFLQSVNQRLQESAPLFFHLHDVAGLASDLGCRRWFDHRHWHESRQPVAPDAIPVYTRSLAGLVAALRGKAAKCLVLDLDGTLWGGTIGDDGLEGIRLGAGSAEGEAFHGFQRHLKALKDRGVLLAVCSKNEEAVAQSPFLKHPESVLKLEDFAAFHANWRPKSESIRLLAAELNLGWDALVFLDDNPAERAQVRDALPAVRVLENDGDPTGYGTLIDDSGFFDVASLTAEDRRRGEAYRARRVMGTAPSAGEDLDRFLSELHMVATLEPVTPESIERVTQLLNKTNQFNMTTQRMTSSEVRALAEKPDGFSVVARLRDRLADHGLVAVAYGSYASETVVIEGFLMSCRVFGRGLEAVVLDAVVTLARARGCPRVRGWMKPTERNAPAQEAYLNLGLRGVENPDPTGPRWFEVLVEEWAPPSHTIRVEHSAPHGEGDHA